MKYLKFIMLFTMGMLCMQYGYAQEYLLGDTQNNPGWYKIGRLTLPQQGADAELKIIAGAGYNAIHTQQGECTIHFRTSNSTANNVGFYGSGSYYNTGRVKIASGIRVVQINLSTWDFYANLPSYTGAGAVVKLVSKQAAWTSSLILLPLPANTIFSDLTEESFMQSVAYFGANVGIGTTTPSEKLAVNGKIHAKEVKIDNDAWPDYVFDDSYQNRSLKDLEVFIRKNKHLPEIPTAADVKQNGVELGLINAKLLQKIEELTLLLIEQNKRIEKMETEITTILTLNK
jgi:hypothetical protein